MGIAYKCDLTGAYADSMDRIKSHDFSESYNDIPYRIRVTIEVVNTAGETLFLSNPAWQQVYQRIKARI